LAPLLVGALIGTWFGILPGAGATAAMFVAYSAVKFVSRRKDLFGKGSEEALAGVEASNNAAAAGELVPTFGLGIPGGAPMVVLMAALTAQGVFVGPSIMQTQPQLLYSVFGGLLVATLVMAVVGYLLIWPSVYVGALSKAASVTLTLVLVVIGIYALRWSMFDVWVTLGMALLGYVMTRLDYPIAPAALAIVLGHLLERNLRTGLIMTDGVVGFVSRPITAALLMLALMSVLVPAILAYRRRHRT
jgi:putative tricarboxylic transport membrane protein